MESIKTNPLTQPLQLTGKNDKRVYVQYTCAKCGNENPDCGFYRNINLNRGHLSWCVNCCSKRTVERRKEKLSGVNKIDGRKCRPRMSEEDRIQRNREKALKHYYKDIEKSRKISRESACRNADPEKKRRNMLKSNYGITPEQWQSMFEDQGCKCAICEDTDPGSKNGWNTDHCHKSGIVRFILCAHCNRGLGAFKDNPEIMRKAADMLEEIQNKPVEAING